MIMKQKIAHIICALSVIYPDRPLLDVGPTLWNLRESLVQMEYITLRFLDFRMTTRNPHNVSDRYSPFGFLGKKGNAIGTLFVCTYTSIFVFVTLHVCFFNIFIIQ